MGKLPAWLVGTVSELEVAGCDDKRGSPRGGQDGDEFLGRWTLVVGPDPEGLGQAGWMDQAERLTDSKGSISYPPLFINHSPMHVVGDDHRGDGKWEGLQAGEEGLGAGNGAGKYMQATALRLSDCSVLP